MAASSTRWTVVISLICLWLAAAACAMAHGTMGEAFANHEVALPALTTVALALSSPVLLVVGAALTTAAVIAVECTVKSEARRFVVQLAGVCLWLLFTALVMLSLTVPFIMLERIS